MSKCQRYYYAWRGHYLSGMGFAGATNAFSVFIKFSTTMRAVTNASVVFSLGTEATAWNLGTESHESGDHTITNISLSQFTPNAAMLRFDASELTKGEEYRYQITNGFIDFSCDL